MSGSSLPPSSPLLTPGSRPIRVATFGDSTADFGGMANADQRALTAAFPSSGATTIALNNNKIVLNYFYPNAVIVGNGGIGGQSTSQMIARTPGGVASANKAPEDILQLSPDVILYRGGSINDFWNHASPGSLVAAATANAAKILQRLSADGALVLVHGIYGFNNGLNTATDLAGTRAAILAQNAALQTLCAGTNGQCVYLDPIAIGVNDGTGAYISTMTMDGTHPSLIGQVLIDKQCAAVIANKFGASGPLRFPGANVVPNATMYSQSGGYAVGFGGYSANGTNVQSVQTIGNKNWQTLAVTPTAANSHGTIYMPYDPSSGGPMGIAANDTWGFEFDWFVTGASGSTVTPAQMQISARLDTWNTSGNRLILDHTAGGAAYWASVPNGQMQGHLVVGPIQYPLASASLERSVFSQSVWYFSAYNIADTTPYIMGVSNPRIVKLGQTISTL